MSFTIGSLFDGSGGFPLAASLCGGTPKWASEIEPYPIAVTKSRFPGVKHLGSVTDIKGGKVEPVDVITFGSPCQDLSVAGKRAGLKHEANGDDETTRSGLFMEAVRIIKEMREATNGVYPRFAIWENVPGAFSSNKGEDFRIVLEELIKVVEPTATMPSVPEKGWPYADSYCGDGWSIAYRVLDAQFWGVPQRRRRIYLVADFRGECAGKVSFEREGLRGYFETGRTPWQTVTGDAERGIGTADCTGVGLDIYNLAVTGEVAASLTTATGQGASNTGPSVIAVDQGGEPAVAYGFDQGATRDVGKLWLEEQSKTLTNGTCPGHHNGVVIAVPVVADACPETADCERECIVMNPWDSQGNQVHDGTGNNIYPCLRACGGAGYQAGYVFAVDQSGGKSGANYAEEVMPALCSDSHGTPHAVAYPYTLKIRSGCEGGGKGALIQEDKSATLATNNDQYLFQPVMTVLDDQGGSQISVREDGKCPTLRAEAHGNLPAVIEQTVAIEGNGSHPSHKGDGYAESDVMYTLNTTEQHAVAYCIGNGQVNDAVQTEKEICKTLNCMVDPMKILIEHPVVIDRAFFNQGENAKYDPAIYTDGTVPTLIARGPSAVAVRYIVRRLTPTECARLQGFPDTWGHPDVKTELTDEEYQFWLNVRNTHAAINDKTTKNYTKEQILKWYNGLHTDSSEYKMWGNGIALPNALYVMQGIADVISEEKASRKKWLDDLLGGCL